MGERFEPLTTLALKVQKRPSARPLDPRPKLGEEVTRYLREALMTGTFEAGERIPVADMARELGVSSMPVREALVALASEGLLEVQPRRGFRVAAIHERDVADVFRVHAHIAGLLVEDATNRMTEATIQSLRSIQSATEELASLHLTVEEHATRVESLNFRFHRTINHVAEASRLRWFLRLTTRYVPQYFYSIPGWSAITVADHPGIIGALETRDAALAKLLMEAHITRGGDLLVANLTKREFWRS
jgi:DNA-binding GntR family transcriptional regulator